MGSLLRNSAWLISLSALAALLSFEGAPDARPVVLAANPVPITPLTAQTTEIEYDNDGIQKSIELRTTAVNASGVRVDTLDTSDGRYVGNSTILDLNQAVRISLDPATESTTTYPMNSKAVAAARQFSTLVQIHLEPSIVRCGDTRPSRRSTTGRSGHLHFTRKAG